MTMTEGPERLMTLVDLSELLGVPVGTLYGWRYRGEGPAGYRIGRHVRYRRSVVEAWIESQADRLRSPDDVDRAPRAAAARQVGPCADGDALQDQPKFGDTSLLKITNGAVRAWMAEMVASGLSPVTVRKAVFALRPCLVAAVSDRRLAQRWMCRCGRALKAASVPLTGPR